MSKEVIIIGAGGHGKVIADIIEKSRDKVYGFLDDNIGKSEVFGYPVLGRIADCVKYLDKEFIVAIGNNKIRKDISDKYSKLKFYTAVHPLALISREVEIEEGSCVMAGAVINASAVVGRHCIVNSGAVVEHDNLIEDYVHISPNATLCGTVKIQSNTHIGAGAVVKNNISICSDVVVGAGSVVIKDIDLPGIYVGVPAKLKK